MWGFLIVRSPVSVFTGYFPRSVLGGLGALTSKSPTCNRTIRSPHAIPALTRWSLQLRDCFVRLMATSGGVV